MAIDPNKAFSDLESKSQTLSKAADVLRDVLGETNDLAKELTEHFESIYKATKNIIRLDENGVNLTKAVLKDTKARQGVLSQIETNISSLEKKLVLAQAAQMAEFQAGLEQKKIELMKEQAELLTRPSNGEKNLGDEISKNEKLLDNLAKTRKLTVEDVKKEIELERNLSREIKLQAGYLAHVKDASYKVLGIFGPLVDRAEAFLKYLKGTPLQFILFDIAAAGFAGILKLSLDRFKELDKAAEHFRKETGFSVSQMADVRKDAEAINREFQVMGIGIEQAYKSAKALTDVFGRTSLVTKDAMQNIALMAANLNVSEEDSAGVLAMFQGLGGASQEVAMNVVKAGAALSEKTGVSFSMVMKDIAGASHETYVLLGANPTQLMKSAIAARALGTDLNKLVSSQKKLLDFSSSVNDELAASAMLGQSITFQRARQLAYEGDIEGAAKATLETVKQAGDFNSMNLYQREALAKASGMDLKDLTKMLTVEKQRDAILHGSDKAKADLLRQQDKELANLKKMADLNDADLVKQGQEAINTQKIQGLVTRLENTFKDMAVTLGDVLEPLITPIVKILVPVLRLIGAVLKPLAGVLKFFLEPLVKAAEWLGTIADRFSAFMDNVSIGSKIVSGFGDKFKSIGTVALTMIQIAGSAGLMYLLFFGRAGISSLLTAIRAPFNLLGGLAKNLIGKFAGGGLAGSVTDKLTGGMGKVTGGVGKLGGGIGKGITGFFRGLSEGVKLMGNNAVFRGILGITLLGLSILPFVGSMYLFSKLDWGKVWQGLAALGALAIGAAVLGIPAVAPFILLGAVVIAALGVALIPFSLAAIMAGSAMVLMGKGIESAVGPIERLAQVDLTKTALGIGAVSVALAAFGSGAAAAGMGSFVGNLLGSDPISKMEKLASIGNQLKVTADSITAISQSLTSFGNVNQFASAVDTLVISLQGLNDELDRLSLIKLAALAVAGTTTTSAPAASGATMDTKGIEDKLDNLTNLLVGGAVRVYMDGRNVSSVLATKGT